MADTVVVVALNAGNIVISQQGKHAVGMWPESSEISQAKHRINTALLRIRNGCFQSQVVAVQSAKQCKLHGGSVRLLRTKR